MSRLFVNQIKENDVVSETYRVAEKALRPNKNGVLYLQFILTDRTGSVSGRLWNATEALFRQFNDGDFVRCEGTAQRFQGNIQVIARKLTKVDSKDVALEDFTRAAVDVAALWKRVRELLGGMKNPKLRDLADCFLTDDAFVERFSRAYAGVRLHHAHPGGLLEHTASTMELASRIASHYGAALDADLLLVGAFLHDVGKMQVKKDILLKPGKLTEEEYEQIKLHSEHGYRMLKEVPNLPLLVAHCAYQHHERINGSGYPRGLKGQDIHLYGKIIAVADVFDAVTTNRVYRKAMLPHEALEILYAGAGTLFEQNIVEAFRNSVAVYPVGLTVILNDRRIGVVVRQNMGTSNRPVVYIIEENGVPVEEPYELNLMKTLDIVITDCDTTMYEPGGIHARQMNE